VDCRQNVGRAIVTCFSLFLISACCLAADVSVDFNNANKLYEQQKFSEAAVAYEKIVETGNVSSALYFNLGNAFFKAGQTGRAIAAYREAEKLSPRDSDVKANLQFARDQVQNSRPPANTLWMQFLDRLTLNEWATLAASAFWLWFLLLILGQWKRDWAKAIRGYAIALGVLAVCSIGCTGFAAQRYFIQDGVVIVPEAVVRRGPFDESQSAFSLRDGAEFTVLDKKENWLQIADTANRIGWVAVNQAALIR
jgi:tetratricopeptide (TPR) repeat protein